MKIKPLAKQVLAQIEKAQSQTSSGLYLPEKATEKTNFGTVIDIGSEVKDIKAGMRIIYEEYAGTKISFEQGEEFVLVSCEKILALVE